jgi:hypothetical protein
VRSVLGHRWPAGTNIPPGQSATVAVNRLAELVLAVDARDGSGLRRQLTVTTDQLARLVAADPGKLRLLEQIAVEIGETNSLLDQILGGPRPIASGGGASPAYGPLQMPVGAGWTPASLIGISDWFRADMGITAPGGVVSAWKSQAGLKTNYGSTSGSPTVAASAAFGGQQGISFASGALIQAVGLATIPPPVTIFMVSTVSSVAVEIQPFESTGTYTIEMGVLSTGKWFVYGGTVLSAAAATATTGAHTMVGVVNGASSILYVDSSATPVATGNAGPNGLGTNPEPGGNGGAATIAEIAIVNGASPITDVAQWMSYVHARYGLAVS